MKTLELHEMEAIEGGREIPAALKCATAAAGTVMFFSSILAGNVFAAIAGPTVVGVAWASCAEAAT